MSKKILLVEEEEELIEDLSRVEHQQWMHWTSYLMNNDDVPQEVVDRWEENHVPYDELDESTKDADRVWAHKVLEVLQARLIEEEDSEDRIQRVIAEETGLEETNIHVSGIGGEMPELTEEPSFYSKIISLNKDFARAVLIICIIAALFAISYIFSSPPVLVGATILLGFWIGYEMSG